MLRGSSMVQVSEIAHFGTDSKRTGGRWGNWSGSTMAVYGNGNIHLHYTPQLGVITLNPIDDCSVDADYPNTNYQSSGYLAVGSQDASVSRYQFFTKFDLSSLAGKTIISAKLKLYVYASASGQSFYIKKVADNSWIETGITWNNQPVMGDTIYTGSTGEKHVRAER